MKKRNFLFYSLVFALWICICTALVGCSGGNLKAPTEFTIDTTGAYSFKCNSKPDMFRIDIYKASDVSNGTIAEGAKVVCKANIPGSKGTVNGTIPAVSRLPYGKYTAAVYSVPKSGSSESETTAVLSETFVRGGSLSTPSFTVTKIEGWGATIKLANDSVQNYLEKEGSYGYTYQLFSDKSCTQQISEGTFGTDIQPNPKQVAGPPNPYIGQSIDFTVEQGTTGVPVSYWVKVKATGNPDINVTDSDWSEAVQVDIDGKAPENNMFGPPQ